MWAWMFAPPKTEKEKMQEIQKEIRKGVRELDRHIQTLQREERKTKREMKEAAQKGHMQAAKMMAKEIVRSRNNQGKIFQMRVQLKATLTHVTLMKTTATMANSMHKTSRLISRLNRQCNLPQMVHIMKIFERETETMGMKQELMEETMDGVTEMEGDEEAEEEILAKVMEEVGISLSDTMENVKIKPLNTNNTIDEELRDRIEKLSK